MLEKQEVEQVAQAVSDKVALAKTPIKKLKGVAKTITIAILIVIVAIGIFGSFNKADFDMVKYTSFLGAFAPFYVILITSIGGGAIADKVAKTKGK